jgi:hypothetical protein
MQGTRGEFTARATAFTGRATASTSQSDGVYGQGNGVYQPERRCPTGYGQGDGV